MSDETTPSTHGPTNQAEALAFYTARNLFCTPVRQAEKKGRLSGWSQNTRRVTPQEFRPGDNVGVLNGTMPGDGWFFHDVDIDVVDAVYRKIVERLIPSTGWWYGRDSKPRSHANYLTRAALRTRKYVGVDGKVIVELRGITQKKTHTLSVGPGSTHASGEMIRFVEPLTAIGRVDDPTILDTYVQHAAIGVIIASVWPEKNRHNLRLAFAKVLLEVGISKERTTEILEVVMEATGSDKEDVSGAVANTQEAMKTGFATAGGSVIIEVLGQDLGTTTLNAINTVMHVGAVTDDGSTINILALTQPMIDRAWKAVCDANDPPGLFKRGDEIVILRDTNNTCLTSLYEEQLKLEEPVPLRGVSGFRPISTDSFREIVGRMIPCVEVRPRQTTAKVYPGRDFASLMISSPVSPLPEPVGFSPIPFFTNEGYLITTPGFHRGSGMFYQPSRDFDLPPIPEKPTKADVAKAVSVLDEMVWQFPFKGRQGQHPYLDMQQGADWRETASFANMMAFPLTILTRSLFNAVPLFLVDKPTTRTGASLMVQAWCYVLTGAWPSEAEWDSSESERRKFLTAILMTGAPIIFLDEVKDLKSPDLNKILTGKGARIGRVLGSTEITNPQNFSTFVATGNNPTFPKDMAGRMCRIRLDSAMSRPSDRTEGWTKDLMTWVPQHRMALLGALYTLVKYWISIGRPPHKETRVLNGFEPWSHTIGGILYSCGLHAFLANKVDVEQDADAEDEDEMEEFVEAWAAGYRDQIITLPVLLGLPGLPSRDGAPWSGRLLGSWLRRNRDRRMLLADNTEVYISKRPARWHWQLRSVVKQGDLAEVEFEPSKYEPREPGSDDGLDL